MGFHQTDKHRTGKGSYHQIGLVRGQFGGVDFGKWLKFVQEAGFDGYEEATWDRIIGVNLRPGVDRRAGQWGSRHVTFLCFGG